MNRSDAQLATVLRLRQRVRDGARRELGEAVRAAAVLEEQRLNLEQSIGQAAIDRREALTQKSPDPEQVLAAGRYELVLRTQAQHLASDRQQIEQEIDRRRVRVAEAEREVRVIEKLQQRHVERRRLAEQRREQREADEFAAQQHARRSTESETNLLPLH